jgi:hypothetical protein
MCVRVAGQACHAVMKPLNYVVGSYITGHPHAHRTEHLHVFFPVVFAAFECRYLAFVEVGKATQTRQVWVDTFRVELALELIGLTQLRLRPQRRTKSPTDVRVPLSGESILSEHFWYHCTLDISSNPPATHFETLTRIAEVHEVLRTPNWVGQ